MGLLVLLDQGVAINSIVSMSFLAYASTVTNLIHHLRNLEIILPSAPHGVLRRAGYNL